MKSVWKILALVMFIALFTTVAYASGRMEEAAGNSSTSSAQSSKTETNAQSGSAASANQAAQSAQTTTGKNGKAYTELPAGTDGTAGKNEKYVLFGEYPQTIMAEGVTINKSKTRQQGEFTYYLGSDGAWYYEGEEHSYDYFEEGDAYLGIECLYSDGSERTIYDWDEPTTRFFKVEPIK